MEVRGLTKRYRDVVAVDDLTFTVEPRCVTGFLGPNGAGKTTTLRMLLDLAAPTAGTATINGRSYRELDEPAKVVGAMLDESGAHRGRSGRDHLRIQCAAGGLPRRRADEMLDFVGLARAGRRPYGEYSFGMRQRLGVAQAMLGDPDVLILDEPANGLDPEGIVWMRELLRTFAAEGRTVLVSSHQIAEVEQTVDNLVIINHGRLVAEGSTSEVIAGLRQDPRIRVRVAHPAVLAAALVAAGATVTADPPDSGGALLVTGMPAAGVSALAGSHGGALYELTEERPDLEQTFLHLTRGEATIR